MMREVQSVKKKVCLAACSAIFAGATFFLGITARAVAGIGTQRPRLAASSAMILAQTEETVSPEQIDKYVAVYKSMQRNHRLTVEQAAAAQGLTLRAFRDLEEHIERNDVARDEVRRALAQSAAQPTNRGRAAPTPTMPR